MNWHRDFDWAGAIELNREALKGIVAALFVLLGLDGDVTVERIPHRLHRAVLRVLRPAESAVRRLIVVAARGLVVKVAPSRPMPKGRKGLRAFPSRLQALRQAHIFPGAGQPPDKIREVSATYPFLRT
jgi:hypothetical protein